MKNWLSKAIVWLVGLGLTGALGWSFVPKPLDVDLAEARVGSMLVTVEEDGKTRIREKYVVSTPLSGRLLRIEMDPGDHLVAGSTLLATIQPRDPELLDARAVAQAEARVRAAEAALAKTGPLLEQARLEQANAEAELERARQAVRGGGITPSEFDTARTRYRQASEEIRSARYAEEIAEFELQQARAALVRSRPPVAGGAADDPHRPEGNGAPAGGWDFTIRSPIDGRVLRVFQESSSVVTAGMALLELGDPTDLEVEIDVLSSDAVAIRPGGRVILEHWGGGRPLEGRVRLVEPAGFTKVSTLGVEEQRVNVIVDLVDPPADRQELGDGYRVEARIVVQQLDDALVVPASALFREGDQTGGEWSVFRVERNTVAGLARQVAARTVVTVTQQNGLQAAVSAGLAPGDLVVVNPSDRVRDGVAVRPR